MQKNTRNRQEDVLSIIVRHYVETAEPVGSRFVSRRLGLSSATIRNVMTDLEEGGYISQPYTSAGRIPTDKGYRYYIDSLMRVRHVSDNFARSIKDEYGHAVKSLEDVLERTSYLISAATNYVGLSLICRQYDKLYFDGASHIIEQPEFRDLRKLYNLIKCLEEKRDILRLMHDDLEKDCVTIRIGDESGSANLKDCSIVSRGYKIKGKVSGRIGVIGPKRMVYERVVPTIEYMANTVSAIFDSLAF